VKLWFSKTEVKKRALQPTISKKSNKIPILTTISVEKSFQIVWPKIAPL